MVSFFGLIPEGCGGFGVEPFSEFIFFVPSGRGSFMHFCFF